MRKNTPTKTLWLYLVGIIGEDMLRLREIDRKLEEIAREKAVESTSETHRLYVEHLTSLEKAYRRERIYALLRDIDDKKDDYSLYEEMIPKGMYR